MFEQKYEKYQNFLSENFHFLVVKFSVYLNRCVFVMFLEYLHLHPMKFVQIKCKVRGRSSSFSRYKRYSEVWSDSREHSENCLLSVWATETLFTNFDEKKSQHVLANQTRSQNSAYIS